MRPTLRTSGSCPGYESENHLFPAQMNDSGLKVNQSLYYLEAYLTPLVCVCTCLECATKHITLPFMIKVLCEQTRELTDDLHDFLDYV